jgi:hypothetical protein
MTIVGYLITVRPKRSRRTYALPTATVAKMIVERVIKADVFARRLEKMRRKRARRRR